MNSYPVRASQPVILLIDLAHMIRRSMYQPNLRELANSKGVPTGAIYGTLQSLKSAVNSLSANAVVVCMEGGHSERRKTVYEHYKERDRSGEPELDEHGYTDYQFYTHQTSWIKEILDTLGIPILQVSGKEGDDIIFQASRLLKGHKIIISEDSDFLSLVSDDISLYRPIKKVFVDMGNFSEIAGLPSPKHYLYYKVMKGDGSDNIPAIAKGVGGKTIQTILENIVNPDEINPDRIIKEAASMKGSRYTKVVEAGVGPIIRNLDLIDISREEFNIFELEAMATTLRTQKYPNVAKVNKIFDALEFNSKNTDYLVNKLSLVSTFGLAPLVNKDYIKSIMLGSTSALQG